MHFFKIIQLIRGVTWQARLVDLRDRGILRLDSHKVSYQSIVHTDEFRSLKAALEEIRPAYAPVSNFADAVALMMLISLIENFRKGLSKTVPRFFTTAYNIGELPLLLEAIDKAGLRQSLMYNTVLGKEHLALRDSDYFVFKATLYAPDPENNQQESGFSNPHVLLELRQRIYAILQPPNVLTAELVNEIAISGRPLIQVIDDLNTFLFFKNVWMPSSIEDQNIALEDLKQVTDQLTSESMKERVNEGIRLAKVSLEENIGEYLLISVFWEQIEMAAETLRKYFKNVITEDVDYFRDFGLLRFAFPESSHERINSVLESLLFGTQDDEEGTHYRVIADCYLAHLAPDDKYIDNLVAAVAVLWVAKMYRQVIILLEKINPSPHFSLDIANAAAIYETKEEAERSTEIIQKLEARCLTSQSPKEKGDLLVGLAYLYFHSWKRKGYGPLWDPPVIENLKVDAIGHELVNRAVSYAKQACIMIGDWDIKKKVYALNQYLYYLVMGVEDDRILDMSTAAESLLRYKDEDRNEWWQYRFDDSLSRYFHRLARSSANAQEWEDYMDRAMIFSQEAMQHMPWDDDIVDYNNRLTIQKKMGFEALVKA